MYVGADADLALDLRDHLEPLGVGVVHYRIPLKAMDNLSEIQPQAILYAQHDFPRHWKVMLNLVRQEFSKERCVFVLLHPGPSLPIEEAEKAAVLEVNAMISLQKGPLEVVRQFQDVYLRYGSFPVLPTSVTRSGAGWPMVIFHPVRNQIVNGLLVQLDLLGGLFRADRRKAIADIPDGTLIARCTVHLDSGILESPIKVLRNRGQLLFAWSYPPATARELIQKTLETSRE